MKNPLLAKRRFRRISLLITSFVLVLTVSACGSGSTSDDGGMDDVATQLYWFPQPEHGNIFAAKAAGYYEDAGMNMENLAGGPRISSTQIVGAGQAEFGMGGAESILQAREQGIPLVAIAANFQTNPQIMMYHSGADIEGPEDLNGRTMYVAPSSTFWEYFKQRYEIEPKQEVAVSGSLAPFISDKESVSQGYITSEPYTLEEEQDVQVDYFLNADLGYNPYVVLFTTERMIDENPEMVRAYVDASMRGWDYYFDNMEEINEAIGEENPELSQDQMAYSADAERDLIYTDATKENGLGYMSEERWRELADQLQQVGSLEESPDVSEAYTNEFLPEQGQ